MYRTAVTTVFLATLAIILADLAVRLLRRRNPSPAQRAPGEEAVSPSPSTLLRFLRVAVNTVALLALAAVASTGFSALLPKENVMTGDRLIWHVAFAPAFAIAAVAITLFWAHQNRFAAADGGRLTSAYTWAIPLRKFFFWSAVVLSVPTLLSILAAMFPLFGTDDQEDLFRIHRYCAPLLAAAAILFTYFALVSWRERSRD
jgi:hypothetical protein